MGKSNQGEKSGKGQAKAKPVKKSAMQHLKEKLEQGLIQKPKFIAVKTMSNVREKFRVVNVNAVNKEGAITLDGRVYHRVLRIEPTENAAALRNWCQGKNEFRDVEINPTEAVRAAAKNGGLLAAMKVAQAKMDEVVTGEAAPILEYARHVEQSSLRRG